jgi:anthranilate/para-aminobenzoate synthase component I
LVARRGNGDDYVYEFGSGGAVVADSDPTAEYAECLLKASTVASALGD